MTLKPELSLADKKLELHRTEPAIIRTIWDAILDDRWMWVVVWGKPRLGKTTFQMQVAYQVYKDWDKVLGSIVFNLSGLLYKMEKGEPERIMTRNMFHNRVPIILADDWGTSANKAETQHDITWDIVKGGWDVLATKVAVIMASMVDPTEPTLQIATKYTHEVSMFQRGTYKFDEVNWQQDFGGWQARKTKRWIETNTFEEVPMDVYKQYDQMRMSLVDEVCQRIYDSMAEHQVEKLSKRLEPLDIEFLSLLKKRGMVGYDFLVDTCQNKYRDALIRAKARSLVVPIRKGSVYWYDLTDLGLSVITYTAQERMNAVNEAEKT